MTVVLISASHYSPKRCGALPETAQLPRWAVFRLGDPSEIMR